MTAFEFQPPTRPSYFANRLKIFLGGSIEMGAAVDWQREVVDKLNPRPVSIFNPRRKDWDSSWTQDLNNPQFFEQVSWELDMLDKSDIIGMYFSGDTKSPISLLELGLHASSGKMIVCCPNEFWRKGNIDVVCQRYGVPVYTNYQTWLIALTNRIDNELSQPKN